MKNKILIFVLGLVAGVTFGVLFSVAIKELLVQFKELHISLNKITLKQSQLSQRLDSIQGKLVVSHHPDSYREPVVNLQSSGVSKQPSAISHQPIADTQKPIPEDSDVVIMTNQLISVTSVPLNNSDTSRANLQTSHSDSAIASMSEVEQQKEPSEYKIEFWKSPLNFKGYKMSKGKIVLYGIDPGSELKLSKPEDNQNSYYLCISQNAYLIEYTDDYKPFEKITDKLTLKKLGL